MRLASTVGAGLGLTGLLAVTLPAPPSSAASPAGSAEAAAAQARQRLPWGPCPAGEKELNEAGARCAEVTVPLDHTDPGGRTIRITVSRIEARDKKHRRGILLSNPGGPGGTGLATTLGLRPVLGKVADRYDLIGFDPRFLGASTPMRCAPAGPQPGPGESTSPREDFEASVRSARDLAERCRPAADLLPHATTRNVARDMDAIRAALGERRLSYYGVSYGADLGAVYTQLFPRRVDRMVIDSSTDPARTQYDLFRGAGEALEAGLDEWAAWAARQHGRYGLGRSAREVRAGVEHLLAETERRPLRIAGTRLNAPVIRLLLRQLVQHQEYDASLASVVRDLSDAAAGKPVEPGPDLSSLLELLSSPELADSLVGGALFMCGDGGWPAGGWPKDPEEYWRNIVRSRATEPVFGPLVNGMIAPCAFWPTAPRDRGTGIANSVPVLMVQALRDNNTPYAGALELHRRLTGSRLVTADIRSHGVYGRGVSGLTPVPCVDRLVNGYLGEGRLPAGDVVCTGGRP